MASTKKPVIGVLAQEITRNVIPENIDGKAYIAASYVKYLEATGAHVLPIFTDYTKEDLKDLFYCMNGMLIPGGGASLVHSQFISNAKLLYDLAIKANDEKDYFPVWGTCLGFEALMVFHGGVAVLSDIDAVDLPLSPQLTGLAKKSNMFRNAPKSLTHMTASPVTYHYHRKCVATETFHGHSQLNNMFYILAQNTDKSGKKFVSAVEAFKYPFYGIQWHPEKVLFEDLPNLKIPRSPSAVQASEYLANFFMEETRKNNHEFMSNEERDSFLINNHQAVYTGDLGRCQEAFVF